MTVEKIYWIDSDGGSLDLTDGIKYSVLQGLDGRWMPPYDMAVNKYYNAPGDQLTLQLTEPRDVTIPIVVYGTSASDFITNLRMLTDAFDPTHGMGKLKVVTTDSKTLYLNCHYEEGMTLPENTDTGNSTFRKFVAVFHAHEPSWYNALENELMWSPYALAGYHSVYNSGDVDTYPIWEFNGPSTAITVTNFNTQKYFKFTYAMGISNDVFQVDTRLGQQSAIVEAAYRVFQDLDTNSTLFPLVPGINVINVEVDGAVDATSYVKCRWVDRYNGV
jgi:phage-related protein